MKTSLVVLGLIASGAVLSLGSVAHAGCFADTVLNMSQVTVTPEKECVQFELSPGGCAGGMGVLIHNTCDRALTVVALEQDGEPVELREDDWDFTYRAGEEKRSVQDGEFVEGRDTTLVYSVVFDGDTPNEAGEMVEVEVIYNASLDETPYEDGTCSVAGSGQDSKAPLGWPLFGVLMLGLCGVVRRLHCSN